MPIPKPKSHLLCRVCKKREKYNGLLCPACSEHYAERAASHDQTAIMVIVKSDTTRQNADIKTQETPNRIEPGIFDRPTDCTALYDGERVCLKPTED